MIIYCLHCGQPIEWSLEFWRHTGTGSLGRISCGGGWASAEPAPPPSRRLSSLELSAAYWMAAYHLAQAKAPEKVHKARELLTLQRFRDRPHHDEEAR